MPDLMGKKLRQGSAGRIPDSRAAEYQKYVNERYTCPPDLHARLVKYCEEIACGAPNLPFYYYHIPAFNNAYLPMLDFLKAVDGRIPNFAGIKYTYESLYEYNQ